MGQTSRGDRIKLSLVVVFSLGCLSLLCLLLIPKHCPYTQNGKCYYDVNTGCPFGQRRYFKNGSSEDPPCDCEEGFVRNPDNSSDTNCYQQWTRGFCEEEQIVVRNNETKERTGQCQNNSCDEPDEYPHIITGGNTCHKAEKNVVSCTNIVYLESEKDDNTN